MNLKDITVCVLYLCFLSQKCAFLYGFQSGQIILHRGNSKINLFSTVPAASVIYRRSVKPSLTLLAQRSNEDGNNSCFSVNSPIHVKGVTLKLAFDENYAVADSSELKSERFTCPESLDLVHKLRRNSDCVLVGKSTVIRDDCTLTVRRVELFEGKKQPARVIIDSKLHILSDEADYAILKDGFETIVYHSDQENKADSPHYNNPNLKTVEISKSGDNIISPKQIIEDLKSKNISHVMVEGGPATAIQFLKQRVVDRAILIRAPVKFIEPVPSGMTDDMFREAGLSLVDKRRCGDDIVEYWLNDGQNWPTADLIDWPN